MTSVESSLGAHWSPPPPPLHFLFLDAFNIICLFAMHIKRGNGLIALLWLPLKITLKKARHIKSLNGILLLPLLLLFSFSSSFSSSSSPSHLLFLLLLFSSYSPPPPPFLFPSSKPVAMQKIQAATTRVLASFCGFPQIQLLIIKGTSTRDSLVDETICPRRVFIIKNV